MSVNVASYFIVYKSTVITVNYTNNYSMICFCAIIRVIFAQLTSTHEHSFVDEVNGMHLTLQKLLFEQQ